MVRLGGTIVVVRLIGPADYGLYSAAAAFVLFVTVTAQMGAEIYLIRQHDEPTRARYNEVFTFLALSSTALAAAGIGASFLLGPYLHPTGVLWLLRVMMLSIPVNVLWAPCQAKIERAFDYRSIGLLELGGDVVLYATTVPLALGGLGPWSLVVGFFAWQSWLLAGSLKISGLRPRWTWSKRTARDLLRHGISYSSAAWIGSLAGLANPLVVGRFAGATGVGFVSFAQRLVSTVGFAARGAWRLGITAMSKISRGDRARLRRAVEQGSQLQLVALAVPLGLFSLVAPFAVPLVFGDAWRQAVPLYGLLALAAALNASGSIQISVLLSRGENWKVAGAVLVQSVVLVGVVVATVPHIGITGYGIATVAALADLVYIDAMARRVVVFDYRSVAPLAVVLVPPTLAAVLPAPLAPLTLVPLLVAFLVPSARARLCSVVTLVISLVGKDGAVTSLQPSRRSSRLSHSRSGLRHGSSSLAARPVDRLLLAVGGLGALVVAAIDSYEAATARAPGWTAFFAGVFVVALGLAAVAGLTLLQMAGGHERRAGRFGEDGQWTDLAYAGAGVRGHKRAALVALDGQIVFGSSSGRGVYEPVEVARCQHPASTTVVPLPISRRRLLRLLDHVAGGFEHSVPEPRCTCGFYASIEPVLPAPDEVLLEVELSGRLLEHGSLRRGERQRVVRIGIPQTCSFGYERRDEGEAPIVAHACGGEAVGLVTAQHRIVPVCRQHASGGLLSPFEVAKRTGLAASWMEDAPPALVGSRGRESLLIKPPAS